MRIIVLFDLPVMTKEERRIATRFRNFLIKDGYYMIQFSVYSRVCNGPDSVEMHIKRIKANLPRNGSIRLMTVTEKQYQSMMVLTGTISLNEKPFVAEQITII